MVAGIFVYVLKQIDARTQSMHFRSLPFSRCFASSLHRTSSTVLIHMVIAFDGFKLQLSSAQLSNQPIFRALVCFNSMKWNGRKLVVRNVSYHIKYWKYCRAKRQRKTALMFPVTASRRATACFQLLSLLPVISIRQQKKRRNNCIECKWLWSVNIITISAHTHVCCCAELILPAMETKAIHFLSVFLDCLFH